jgi:fumarate reductase flavoprotein subunit
MKSYDVIIVGAGTAGIPAALVAGKRGLSVALVEAADQIGGTLHLSTASISAAGTSIQARQGVVDSADDHFADYQRINHGTGNAVLVRKWMDQAADTIEWMISMGWSAREDVAMFAPEHDLYTIPRTYRSMGLGVAVAEMFSAELDKAIADGAAIDILLNSRFTKLVSENGAVTGIEGTGPDGAFSLAAKAVILTTGGFTGSAEKWRTFHDIEPLRYGLPTCQGDAIDAVRAVGGTTWYDDYFLPAFGGTRDLGGPPSSWIHSFMLPAMRQPWEIYVNLDGERFMPEDEPQIFKRELAIKGQREWGFWVVYDQNVRDQSPALFRLTPEEQDAKFAGDDADFVSANTVEELAEKMGVPVAALRHSVETYNAGQAVGSDMLGREHMPVSLDKAPYYAVRHFGFTISSYPGVKVNDDLAVVTADGAPIAGLYAAGEAIGIGFLGLGFLSGSIVSSAITFGRQLGQTILADA